MLDQLTSRFCRISEYLVFFLLCVFVFGDMDWTEDFTHAKQACCHWTTQSIFIPLFLGFVSNDNGSWDDFGTSAHLPLN